jgi:hypothetical protein
VIRCSALSIVRCSKRSAAVLEEWIRNVPMSLVKRIVEDAKVIGSPIWVLAFVELARRRGSLARAA